MTITDIGIEAPDEDSAKEPEHRTLLEVWTELLKPAEANSVKPISLQWAVRLKTEYPHLTFAELDLVRVGYFARLRELTDILAYEVSSDPLCFDRHTVEEDAEENGYHYRSLLLMWQSAFILWESEWSANSPTAAVDAAVIAEVHKMFFGQVGLIAHLDSINFEFIESDQAAMAEALTEIDESLKAGTGE